MKHGLDMTALREVKFLQELKHPNIISVRVENGRHGCDTVCTTMLIRPSY